MRTSIRALLLTGVLVGIASLAAPPLLGFSLWQIPTAVAVSSAMAAKIGCSAHFLSGLGHDRIIADLLTYSPVNRFVNLTVADHRASANLLGLAPTSATFRPQLGCTLDLGDPSTLDAFSTTPVSSDTTIALDIEPRTQAMLEGIMAKDTELGLETRALVVLHRGRLVAESYAEGITPATPLHGWSMGKSITAMLVGRLQAMGRLTGESTGQPPLFPEWAADPRRTVRLTDLLQMSSGLDFDETYAPGSDSTRMLFLDHSVITTALASPLAQPPGSHFSYSSGTTNLIMELLQRELGGHQALRDFLDQELRRPLGLAATILEPDPSGLPVGSSYVYASGRDWARLGQLMLRQGEWNGAQLLDKAWVTAATMPNRSANERAYGYQFWLNQGDAEPRWPELPIDTYAMMGNRGQVVLIVPSHDAVLVRLGWNAGPYPMETRFPTVLAHLQTTATADRKATTEPLLVGEDEPALAGAAL